MRIIAYLLLSYISLLSPQAFALSAGEAAPNITLPFMNSTNTLNIAELKGQVVYVDFWASWCAPCRKSLPWLNTLRNELHAQGFEVVAINVDEYEESGIDFLNVHPVSYPVLFDINGDAYESYSPPGIPTSYLIDRQGIVRWVHAGFKEADTAAIRQAVLQLINNK